MKLPIDLASKMGNPSKCGIFVLKKIKPDIDLENGPLFYLTLMIS